MGVLCLPTAPFPLIIPNILWQTSHMNRLLILPVLLLTLVVGTPAFSADFQKGLTAAQSGDFATALREWTPLAKQVDADAQIMLVRCISGQNWIGGCLSRSSHEI